MEVAAVPPALAPKGRVLESPPCARLSKGLCQGQRMGPQSRDSLCRQVPGHPGAGELASYRHPCSARWRWSAAQALFRQLVHMLIASLPHPGTPLRLTSTDSGRPPLQPLLHRSEPSVGQRLYTVSRSQQKPRRQTEARHPKPPIHQLLNSRPWLPCWAPCRQLPWPCSALGWREQRGFTGSCPGGGGLRGGSQPLHTKHSQTALHGLNSNPWRMAPKKRWVQERKGRAGRRAGIRGGGGQLKSF